MTSMNALLGLTIGLLRVTYRRAKSHVGSICIIIIVISTIMDHSRGRAALSLEQYY